MAASPVPILPSALMAAWASIASLLSASAASCGTAFASPLSPSEPTTPILRSPSSVPRAALSASPALGEPWCWSANLAKCASSLSARSAARTGTDCSVPICLRSLQTHCLAANVASFAASTVRSRASTAAATSAGADLSASSIAAACFLSCANSYFMSAGSSLPGRMASAAFAMSEASIVIRMLRYATGP